MDNYTYLRRRALSRLHEILAALLTGTKKRLFELCNYNTHPLRPHYAYVNDPIVFLSGP